MAHKSAPQDPSLAETLGKGFAVVQHGIDRVIEWGFASMKGAASAPKVESDNPHVQKALHAGKALLGFVGKAGEAYYRHYETLKRRRSE